MLNKILIDIDIPFLKGVFEDHFNEVVYQKGDAICKGHVQDADALIVRTRTKCNQSLLEGTSVRFIATATIGMDHIDLEYCRRNGIEVVNAAGCNSRGVLQWVSAVLAMCVDDPFRKTIGIVGVGNVGRLIEEYSMSWGFRVLCSDPPREEREHLGYVDLETILRESDIVTFHVPLLDTTRHMLSSRNIGLLKSGAIVVNASRGEVVENAALLRNDITVACDVWENEPDLNCSLLQKAVVATPHIAGYSRQGKANASSMTVDSVSRFFNLGIEGWYPQGVNRDTRKKISWEEMKRDIQNYCNLSLESKVLKENAGAFEELRNKYNYREEFF